MVTLANCRSCGSSQLVCVVDLGSVALSGVFPPTLSIVVPTHPLRVGLCRNCGLSQLMESASPSDLFGSEYGYRSALNASMAAHLARVARGAETWAALDGRSTVLDIGSNDGTLLASYRNKQIKRIGIDPTIGRFAQYYEPEIVQIRDFFSLETYGRATSEPASVVTSMAMFYDLPNPIDFARDVEALLAPDGVWILEQSYTPWVLRHTAYDTICHEHLEYYTFTTLRDILHRANLRVVEVTRNSTNGGSLQVVAAKASSRHRTNNEYASLLLRQEEQDQVHSAVTWEAFSQRIAQRQHEILSLLQMLAEGGSTVMALGASTKGNVLMQTSRVSPELVSAVGDVNRDKWGRVLPGSGIPILSEDEVLASEPDYLLVLPWHFRDAFISRLEDYLESGGRLIFPLPEVEIVGG